MMQRMMVSLQDMLHYVHPILIPILHNIGQLQYRRGDIHMAMETYTLALRRAQRMYGGQHPHVASALNCLGVLHYYGANSLEESEIETAVAGPGPGCQQGMWPSSSVRLHKSTKRSVNMTRLLNCTSEPLHRSCCVG